MRHSRPHRIDSLLSEAVVAGSIDSSLSQIRQRAIMLLKLNRAVHSLLPTSLRPLCHVVNVRHEVMVLGIANACWKMMVMYEQPKLLSALRSQILPSLISINIRINPNQVRKQELNEQNHNSILQTGIKARCLSVQSAVSIRHVAARSEGKLKNALERLAILAGDSVTSHDI
ncbi:MAG: DUF721 domain-containing protein [Sodalis sp. (in: enterobacteria)]